jgi:hypothetical protein
MKVVITLEDTPKGIYPVVQWTGNDVTDNVHESLSMNLAAQVAYMIRDYATTGVLKVADKAEFQ